MSGFQSLTIDNGATDGATEGVMGAEGVEAREPTAADVTDILRARPGQQRAPGVRMEEEARPHEALQC